MVGNSVGNMLTMAMPMEMLIRLNSYYVHHLNEHVSMLIGTKRRCTAEADGNFRYLVRNRSAGQI